jgi:Uma2 family endonuclease
MQIFKVKYLCCYAAMSASGDSVFFQVASTRFRIPDVCILSIEAPRERVIRSSIPLLCVEVLSPRDSLTGMRRRAADYFARGVQTVWILDPETRTAYQCGPDSIEERQQGTLDVTGTPISLDIQQIFRVLDR